MTRRPLLERFEEKYIPEPNSGCWLWTASATAKGYGFFWDGEMTRYAHRFSYELSVGKIPAGLHLDHLCRIPCCVNPDHLEAVTPTENARRSEGVSTINSRKTHCLRGHALAGQNIYRPPNRNGRECRKCRSYAGKIRRHLNG